MAVVFRKEVVARQVLPFLASQLLCLVAMETCASAHHWARENAGFEAQRQSPGFPDPAAPSMMAARVQASASLDHE